EGRNMLKKIKLKFHGLNPACHYIWSDNNGEEIIFDGQITMWLNTKYKCVNGMQFHQFIPLVTCNYSNFKINDNVCVKLHFYLNGIKAEIVPSIQTPSLQ